MINDEVELLINREGTKYYVLKNNILDLNDKNIIDFKDGTKELNGSLYCNNKLIHREDGPAIVYSNKDKVWYKKGLIHRDVGPAIEFLNGDNCWYKNGLLHRLDGPAIEWIEGDKEYWINGEIMTEKEFNIFVIKKFYQDIKKDIVNKQKSKRVKI